MPQTCPINLFSCYANKPTMETFQLTKFSIEESENERWHPMRRFYSINTVSKTTRSRSEVRVISVLKDTIISPGGELANQDLCPCSTAGITWDQVPGEEAPDLQCWPNTKDLKVLLKMISLREPKGRNAT